MPCPPGMPQNRMPGTGGNVKPDNAVWGHPARNGTWDTHEGGPPVGTDYTLYPVCNNYPVFAEQKN